MSRGVLLSQASAFTGAADSIEAGDIPRAVAALEEIGDYYADKHVGLSGAAWREAQNLPSMTAEERGSCVAYLRGEAAGLALMFEEQS